jgi:hypothetical protein
MQEFAHCLSSRLKDSGIAIGSCGEALDFSSFGIGHNSCIDAGLMTRLFPDDAVLMEELGARGRQDYLFSGMQPEPAAVLKDPHQRPGCLCMRSKDIGMYSSCPHGCVYCYANASHAAALKNFHRHDPHSESLSFLKALP